jgi:hypothetical protein
VQQGADAVLEEEKVGNATVQQLASTKDEHVVVALLLPLLRDVFQSSGRVIANSEQFEWPAIHDASPRKPDLVIALPQFLHKKNWKPSNKTSSDVVKARAADVSLIFGVPASSSISGDAVHEVEAKTDIGTPDKNTGNAGLGELKNYMLARIAAMNQTRWTDKRPLPDFIQSMLIGREYFWLVMMDTEGGTLASLQWGKWTDPGSVNAIRQFFPLLDWESATSDVFNKLADHSNKLADHSIVPYDQFKADNDGPDNCVLGQGGMGRVFRATTGDGPVAIKIVLSRDIGRLEKEFQILKKFESRPLPLVKPCSEFCFDMSVGAGYAMRPVGKRSLANDFNVDLVCPAFRSLFELHVQGVVHGDARLANLLEDEDGKLFWADVSSATLLPGKFAFSSDMATLIQSCSGTQLAALGAGIDALLSNYASSEKCSESDMNEHFSQFVQPIVDLVVGLLSE